MLTSVILIVLMLLLSAFFSGMEIAFTSKNRLKLEIDRKQSRMFDRIADIFSRHPGQYITTILVGNNIALVIYSLYMSLLLRGIFYALGWESIARNGSVAIETAVSTVIIIFFAEFLPKSVFRNNPNFYYRALAPVIYFFYLLLYPIARLTTLISHGILRLTGRRVEERTTTHSFDREDLASLLDTNSSEPRPEPDNELKLFQNALDFADLRVRDARCRAWTSRPWTSTIRPSNSSRRVSSIPSIRVSSSGARASTTSSAISTRRVCSPVRPVFPT